MQPALSASNAWIKSDQDRGAFLGVSRMDGLGLTCLPEFWEEDALHEGAPCLSLGQALSHLVTFKESPYEQTDSLPAAYLPRLRWPHGRGPHLGLQRKRSPLLRHGRPVLQIFFSRRRHERRGL